MRTWLVLAWDSGRGGAPGRRTSCVRRTTHEAPSRRAACPWPCAPPSCPVTACGGGSDSRPSRDGASDGAEDHQDHLKDGTVTPNGDRVEVAVDEPIELMVDSDVEGELHVHSAPEQEFAYGVGHDQARGRRDHKPGMVEIEVHTLDKVVVQLEVQ